MALRTTAAPSALALLLALAGCSSPPAASGQETGAPAPPSASTAPEPLAEAAPEEPPGLLDAAVAGEAQMDYNLTGCLNPRMLFALDPADAQALLPPGYHAADVGALLPFAGLPPPGFDTGRAVGGYDLLSCAGGSHGAARFSQVGILVDAPGLGDRTPAGEATINLYLLALHTDHPEWRAFLLASGFHEADARLAAVSSSLEETPVAGHGTGAVAVERPVAEVEYGLTSSGRALDLHGRYWHTGANGTFYLDFRLGEDVRAGPIPACAHVAGSAYAAVSGATSCGPEPRFAAVGVGTEVAGTAYWLPGVFPA